MLPPTPPNLDPSTRLFLALLSTLNQTLQAPLSPPPYTSPFPSTNDRKFKLTTTTTGDLEDDDSDSTIPPAPPLRIHINATTTIQGNSNRIMLPSPSSTQENLSKLVSLAIKDVLPPPSSVSNGIEEGEVREQMIEVTLDAGTKIEGSGNVVVYRKGEELDGGAGREGEKGRKKRAGSEPIDVLRAANAKRVRS